MTGADPAAPPVELIDTAAAGPAAMRGGILRTASFAVSLLIGLASAPLLVRHLGSVEFGRYSTVVALIAVVVGLTEGGVATVALRELSATRDDEQRRRLMSDLLGLRIVLSAAGIALAVGFSMLAGYGASLTVGALLAGAGMVLAVTQALLVTVLHSQLRFGWAAAIELVKGLLTVTLIIALVLADASRNALLAISIPVGLLALVLTVPVVRAQTTLRPSFNPRRWTRLLRDVLVIAVAVAVYALYFRVALLVTSLASTAEQTGYFAISFRVTEALIMTPVLLVGAAFPIISRSLRDDRERFEYAVSRIYELSLFVGGLIALGLLVSAPFAIEVIVGSREHPSVQVLQIQSVALLASFVVAAASFPLLGLRRHRDILVANCVSLVIAAALAVALVPAHGATGAAIAAVAADIALAITTTTMLLRCSGRVLPLSAIPVALAACLGGYGAASLVGVHPLVDAIIGAVVFLAVLVIARRFPPELRELLTSKRIR